MRYEVYGIYNDDGTNYGPVTVKRTLKQAIASAQSDVATGCKYWAVLVRARKNAYPYELISGLRGGPPTRATMLVEPSPKYGNPIMCESDAKRYWSNS